MVVRACRVGVRAAHEAPLGAESMKLLVCPLSKVRRRLARGPLRSPRSRGCGRPS